MALEQLLLLLAICGQLSTSETPCSPFYAKRVAALDDKLITTSVMWTFNNLTKYECLEACGREKFCLSFHFDPVEPACVGLRQRFIGVAVGVVSKAGNMMYLMNKPLPVPGSECEIDIDCVSLPNFTCYAGLCKCALGYDYNGITCRNLKDCNTFNNKFTKYERSFITESNLSSRDTTEAGCPLFCASIDNCKSAEYNHVTGVCYANGLTWTEATQVNTDDDKNNFYQRRCDW